MPGDSADRWRVKVGAVCERSAKAVPPLCLQRFPLERNLVF